jgi:hypothetical protein
MTGKAYTTTKPQAAQVANGLDASACGYNGSDSGFPIALAIQIFYGSPSASLAYLAQQDSSLGSPLTTAVSGIGDKALTDGSDDLAVQFGSDVIYVEDISEPPSTPLVTLSAMKQLAQLTHQAQQ